MINSTDARNALNALANDDDISAAIRDMLICDDTYARDECADCLQLPTALIDTLVYLIDALDTESTTDMLLAFSLCPMHRIDYAICFDDETDECATIRIIHPSHDT